MMGLAEDRALMDEPVSLTMKRAEWIQICTVLEIGARAAAQDIAITANEGAAPLDKVQMIKILMVACAHNFSNETLSALLPTHPAEGATLDGLDDFKDFLRRAGCP